MTEQQVKDWVDQFDTEQWEQEMTEQRNWKFETMQRRETREQRWQRLEEMREQLRQWRSEGFAWCESPEQEQERRREFRRVKEQHDKLHYELFWSND